MSKTFLVPFKTQKVHQNYVSEFFAQKHNIKLMQFCIIFF